MIPVAFGRAARDTLLAAGAEVLYQEYPLPHTLDPHVPGRGARVARAERALA